MASSALLAIIDGPDVTANLYHVGLSSSTSGPGEVISHETCRSSLCVSVLNTSHVRDAEISLGSLGSGVGVNFVTGISAIATSGVLTRSDLGGMIEQAVFVDGSHTFFDNVTAYIIECICSNNERLIGCDLRNKYDFRTYSLTALAGSAYGRLIPPRSSRVALIIAVPVGSLAGDNAILSLSQSGSQIFYINAMPFTLVMPYRDWGPIIGQEIWLSCSKSGAIVTATEVYPVN